MAKINRNKLKTVREMREGREVLVVLVPKSELSILKNTDDSMKNSQIDTVAPESFSANSMNHSKSLPVQDEWLTEKKRLEEENADLRRQLMSAIETITKRDEANTELSNQLNSAHRILSKREELVHVDPKEQRIKELEARLTAKKTFAEKLKSFFE